ncbi:MAG: acyl-CoA dehydrogenase [Gemmatimonadales bacterium]
MADLLSRPDLEFLLYEVLDTETLCQRPRYADHSRATFDAMLDTARQVAERFFLPHWKAADEAEPRFDGERVHLHPEVGPALAAFAEAGFLGAGHDAELGGLQLPCVVEKACFAHFKAANVATASYPLLTGAAANLILAHGTADQVDRYVRPMLAGRFFGTMALSETQAGSSLADLTTRAVPQPDGGYRLFGSKMWLSAGDHELSENIVHLVLARIEGAAAGVKGISLFLVPKWLVADDGSLGERNDVSITGINHKMGYRGTVNTVFELGDGRHQPGGRPGAIGALVGAPHQGLAAMFHMMNEARIGVGLGAVVLGYRGYLASLEYARTRLQGRPLGAKDPNSAQVPIIAHPDVRRMLLHQKAVVEGGLALCLYCARLVDEQRTGATEEARRHAGRLLDLLTPIAKAWPSEFCLEANHLAIQVLGGYGYSREYPVEQLYRDNRLNPIHEGTDGIQALDLLGRRVRQEDGAALTLLLDRIQSAADEAISLADPRIRRLGESLGRSAEDLATTTRVLLAATDTERALANAFPYLVAFGHTVVGWLWVEQALAAFRGIEDADPARQPFYRGKLHAADYFFDWIVAGAAPLHGALRRLDDLSLTMKGEWF